MNQKDNNSFGRYPRTRMRRNRQASWVRAMVSEIALSASDLIWPVFVTEGGNSRDSIPSMPGVERLGIDALIETIYEVKDLGIPAIAIFPYTEEPLKSPDAKEAYNPKNLVCRAIKRVKKAHPDIGVICDVALDLYNSDGHDGLVENGKILNDETVEVLCRQSVVQAQAGCDVVAPSDMMDGRIAAIRDSLDIEGFQNVSILAYAAKYASAFYGPFRDAVGSSGALKGDKKTYQMDPANAREAITEAQLDEQEGADIMMVKPGLAYLDIIHRLRLESELPIAAYNVSGEYSMVKAAAEKGWIDERSVVLETLLSFKRAGADLILTYHACDAAEWLKQG